MFALSLSCVESVQNILGHFLLWNARKTDIDKFWGFVNCWVIIKQIQEVFYNLGKIDLIIVN